jgi:hypothetical protein
MPQTLTTSKEAASPVPKSSEHEDFDIDITWHNLYGPSTFQCFRKVSQGPIERILVDFAKVVESGIFEKVMSVNASKHAFYVTVVCTRDQDQELMDAILSVH